MKIYIKQILMCGCAYLCMGVTQAQKSIWSYLGRSSDLRDSNYIKTYHRTIIGRLYYTRENTGLTMQAPETDGFDYKPNNSKGIGLGVTYRDITLNLSFKLLGAPKDKGNTKSFSLASSLYKEQWVYDFGYQRFKGLYLSPESVYSGQDDAYYHRPDISSTFVGGDFWRVLNSDRFSYRGVMTQSERQLKSAGTPLLGGALSFGSAKGDSALVPAALADRFPQSAVDKMHFFRLGVGAGYAYTWVFKEHFFVSGSLTGNMDWTSTREFTPTEDRTKNELAPNLAYRISVGYNSHRMMFNASMVNSSVSAKGAYSPDNYRLFKQQFRITIARRFTPGRKTKKVIAPVDNQIDRAKGKIDNLKDKLNPRRSDKSDANNASD